MESIAKYKLFHIPWIHKHIKVISYNAGFTGVPHCPAGMHPYHTRCDKDTISQKTCDSPEPVNLGKGFCGLLKIPYVHKIQ